MYYMKKILFTVLTLFMLSFSANCAEHPISLGCIEDDYLDHGGHRTPINLSWLPTIVFNDTSSTLTFAGNSDLGSITITIHNEDGTTVLSELVYVEDGTVSVLSVAQLPVGNYTLYIEIDGSTYSGEFTI